MRKRITQKAAREAMRDAARLHDELLDARMVAARLHDQLLDARAVAERAEADLKLCREAMEIAQAEKKAWRDKLLGLSHRLSGSKLVATWDDVPEHVVSTINVAHALGHVIVLTPKDVRYAFHVVDPSGAEQRNQSLQVFAYKQEAA